jgi:hypothetical protein
MGKSVLYSVVVPGEVTTADSKTFAITLARMLVKKEGFDVAVVARSVEEDGRLTERTLVFGVWRKDGKVFSSTSESVIRLHAATNDFGSALDAPDASKPQKTRKGWDYASYWTAVLGSRSPAQVVEHFRLKPSDLHGLDEWLVRAEEQAWRTRGSIAQMPESWWEFHQRALDDLTKTAAVTVRRQA